MASTTQELTPVDAGARRAAARLDLLARRLGGVRGALVATLDGRPVVHTLVGHSPGAVAAMVASSLSLSHRLGDLCGPGSLSEMMVRSSSGYVFLYAVGVAHVLAVLTDPAINVARLGLEVRDLIESLLPLLPMPQ
jgi:predicted regulator of Ras-like GTPase activity (Roadblock/LC7/MglB family)